METLGLQLLHKKINRGTKITPTSPCWTAEEQEVAEHLVFLFLLDYFLLSKSKLLYSPSSLFLYVRNSVQMKKKNKTKKPPEKTPEQKH